MRDSCLCGVLYGFSGCRGLDCSTYDAGLLRLVSLRRLIIDFTYGDFFWALEFYCFEFIDLLCLFLAVLLEPQLSFLPLFVRYVVLTVSFSGLWSFWYLPVSSSLPGHLSLKIWEGFSFFFVQEVFATYQLAVLFLKCRIKLYEVLLA